MACQLRVDYLTLDDEIAEVVRSVADSDESVVLQRPLYDAYPLIADEVRGNFSQLKTSLENAGADVTVVSTRTEDASAQRSEDDWGTAQTITAVVTAALVFATLPVLFALRLLFDYTDDPRFLVVQRWILDRITINEVWRTEWKQDLEATNERLRDEARSVREATGTQPVVVTQYDADITGVA